MSDNYENYSYEDSNMETPNKSRTKTRLLIVVLLLIAIVVTIFLLKGCKKDETVKPSPMQESGLSKHERELLEAGKKYFEFNSHKSPKELGECVKVDLKTLKDIGYIDNENYEKCNDEATYVNVCLVDNDMYQWTPWMACEFQDSNYEYDKTKEGNISDLKKDESLVSFMFMPYMSKSGEEVLGPIEELWESDIKYPSYKTLSKQAYYKYRDQSWIWNTSTKYYYTLAGEVTDPSKVKEYYPSSPSNKYNLSDSKATVYKWYEPEKEIKEYYMENGQKASRINAPSGYPEKDNPHKVTYYGRRATDKARYYYVCKVNPNDTIVIYQQVKCGSGQNPSAVYTVKEYWGCVSGYNPESTPITKSTVCYKWNTSKTPCTSGETNCSSTEVTQYNWYRKVYQGERKYFPSNSTAAGNEKVYYLSSPKTGTVKDEATKTTGYKWYYEIKGQTSQYFSEKPVNGTTKASEVKWSDWGDWSDKKPAEKSYRSIESAAKVKLQEIKGTTSNNWEKLSENYLTFEEMIDLLKSKGYEVNSLLDIVNNANIKYDTKLLFRNKKLGDM